MIPNDYKQLFSPFWIRGKYFKNRIFTAPMDQSGVFDYYTREALEQYSSFARGGVGVVELGEAGVHSLTDHAHPNMPHLDDETTISSLIQAVDLIHKWGALASVELTHSGNRSNPKYLAQGGYVIGPCAMTNLYGASVIEMDEDMMSMIADAYANAAYMAKFAGCDIVNVHGGHGWLISQFLSKLDNHRTDKFGGTMENRARFPIMILDRIREKCGEDLVIEMRISGTECIQGGLEIDDMVEFAKLIDGKVDIIHVSSATFHETSTSSRMFPTVFYPRGCNVENASKIKQCVNKSLVSVVGGLNDPSHMNSIIDEGKVDFVVVGRQMFADPNWPNKAKKGMADEIIKCIRCEECISAGFIPHVPFDSGVLRCAVNPRFGREFETTRSEESIKQAKYIMIAGGGPAGMEAAITAADRGHRVLICEKSNVLGANLAYANNIDFKYDIVEFLNGLRANIASRKNIEVRLNTEVTDSLIMQEHPDTLIVACGAKPIKPAIEGIDEKYTHSITSLYLDNIEVGEKVVIIGGGLAGCEEALALTKQGKKVVILEAKDKLAADAPYIHWRHLLEIIDDNVDYSCNVVVKSITDHKVITEVNGKDQVIYYADTVLYATGMRPTIESFTKWEDMVEDIVYIGDCMKPGKILTAMRTGYCAGVTV